MRQKFKAERTSTRLLDDHQQLMHVLAQPTHNAHVHPDAYIPVCADDLSVTWNAPNSPLGAALLAGGVTSLVGLFCVGLVEDTQVLPVVSPTCW